jgi:hypothetical protein
LNPDFSIEKSALCAASGWVNPAEGGLKANFAVAKFGLKCLAGRTVSETPQNQSPIKYQAICSWRGIFCHPNFHKYF